MRIVIVGGSKFGRAAAERLVEKGHDVVLIDKDRTRLERLADQLDCGMIEGDGTSPAILREAHQSDKDVLIALTNASDDNILAALVGRSVGYDRVIPQIVTSDLMEVCAELDLTDTIAPHASVANTLCQALEEDSAVSEDLSLSGALRLKRVDITEGCTAETLGDIDLPETCRAIAHIRGDTETLATHETGLQEGDQVLLVVETQHVEALNKLFN